MTEDVLEDQEEVKYETGSLDVHAEIKAETSGKKKKAYSQDTVQYSITKI